MMTETGDRMRVVVYYAVWATICAAIGGIVVTLMHTWFFSFNPGASALMKTLFEGSITALAIAAAQGAVALATGGVLARLGRGLQYTVLLGLVIGVFDVAMYFLQMTVPATELGWVPDIIILCGAAAVITAAGARRRTVTAS
jgi:hypothetical protein